MLVGHLANFWDVSGRSRFFLFQSVTIWSSIHDNKSMKNPCINKRCADNIVLVNFLFSCRRCNCWCNRSWLRKSLGYTCRFNWSNFSFVCLDFTRQFTPNLAAPSLFKLEASGYSFALFSVHSLALFTNKLPLYFRFIPAFKSAKKLSLLSSSVSASTLVCSDQCQNRTLRSCAWPFWEFLSEFFYFLAGLKFSHLHYKHHSYHKAYCATMLIP